ncbi:MAG: hypothetical protein FJW40_02965 [Acidobacteria bacterium]|nr:hypothetical protein [Acidobacteriota bacterium]
MKTRILLAGATLAATLLQGQTTINGGRTIQGSLDASAATLTKPAKSGATLPATCSAGEMFFRTTSLAGQNLHLCSTDNNWAQVSGGAGGPHANSHQHGGADEVATATPGANAIVKANGTGRLASGWSPLLTSSVGFGFWSPFGSSGSATTPFTVSGTHRVYQIVVSEAITVGRLSVNVFAASAGSTMKFAIWDQACGTMLAQSAVASSATTGAKTVTLSPALTLNPGVYHVSFTGSATGVQLWAGAVHASGLDILNAGTVKRAGTVAALTWVAGDVTFPASCGTITASNTLPPAIYLEP